MLYDDESYDGYGEFVYSTTGATVSGYTYLYEAANAATETLLSDAYPTTPEDAEGEDISAEFAPVRYDDIPDNDAWDAIERLLSDERVAAIVEHYGISPYDFGYNFTLTRNNEGCGFWSRGWDGFTAHTDSSLTYQFTMNDGEYLTELTHLSGGARVFFDRDENDELVENTYFLKG